MNWTGGNLSRLSKGANNDLIQRQRIHFAKSRNRLQESTSTASELDISHLSPDVDVVRPLSCVMSYNDSGSRILKAPLSTTGLHATLRETDTRLCSSGRHHPADLLDFEDQIRVHKRPRKMSSTDVHRHRLLTSKDWLGLELAKPLQLNVRRTRTEHRPVKRRRPHVRHDMETQSRRGSVPLYRDASIVFDPQLKEPVLEVGSDNISIRIGSRALKSWPSDSSTFGSPITLMNNAQTDHQPEYRSESEHNFIKYGEMKRGLDTTPEHGDCMDESERHLADAEICNPNRKIPLRTGGNGVTLTTIIRPAPTSMNDCDSFVSQNHVAYPSFLEEEDLYNEGPENPVNHTPMYHSSHVNDSQLNAIPIGMLPGIYDGEMKRKEGDHHQNLTESRNDAETVDQKWRQLLGLEASISPESNSSGGRDKKLAIERDMLSCSLPDKNQQYQFQEESDTNSTPHSDWTNVNRTLVASPELGSVLKDDEEILAGQDLQSQGQIQSRERTGELWKRFIFGPDYQDTPWMYQTDTEA